MSYLKYIKEIRELRNIHQNDMLPSTMSHSAYSKIENGKTALKLDTLNQINDRLNISMSELIHYAEHADQFEIFLKKFNKAISSPNDEHLKNDILQHIYYQPTKNIQDMSNKELIVYSTVKTTFSDIWSQVSALTFPETEFICQYIEQTEFYGQYDYLLILNTVINFTEEQTERILSCMYPVKHQEKRNSKTLNYSFLLLTNVTTVAIYNLDYKRAMRSVKLAENLMDKTTSYYSRILLEYHKNIVLRFLNKDTIYIEKARQIIQIIRFIGDEQTANTFESELNNLNSKADYYLDKNKYPTIQVNK